MQLVINEAVDVKSLKVYVTPQFVQEFLELFDSEESVERDYLKNILHKLYAKVTIYFRIFLTNSDTKLHPPIYINIPIVSSKEKDDQKGN